MLKGQHEAKLIADGRDQESGIVPSGSKWEELKISQSSAAHTTSV